MSLFLIFLSLFLGISFRKSFIIVGIIFISLFIKLLSKRFIRLSLIIGGVFLFGFGISYINISYPNKTNYVGIVYEVKDNYFLYNSNGEKLYCYEKNHKYEIGDIISINGYREDFDYTVLESDFDFGNYLHNKGVHHSLKIGNSKVNFSNPIRLKSFRIFFLNKFDEKTRISVKSILFSDHDDNELTNSISSMHLGRLINASGLYFNALLGLLTGLFERKMKTKWSKLLALGFSSFYLILTFPKFSIIRLTTFYAAKWINEYLLNKRFSYLEIIAIIGISFLLLDYSLAYQDGFILGFGIPVYLFITNNSFLHMKKWKKRILIIVLLYIFFIPFELSFYNSVNPLLVIYQFVLTPLFILFFFIQILCLYGLPLFKVANFYNDVLSKIINPFSKLSLEINAGKPNDLLFLIYYVILFGLLYYASIKLKPFRRFFLMAYLTSLLLYFFPFENIVTQEVDFINVGQGDCCFIRHKTTSILIDTGGLSYKDVAKDCLIPFLKKKRVYNLDLVITTHDDYDHNGALSSLRENFKVKKEMTNLNFAPITVGNITFTNYNNHIKESSEDNEMSLVIGFRLGKKDYLITGDAGKNIEKYMMQEYKNIPCDILKVGHHGSNTSTTDAFIKYLQPEIGIISCGKNNKYGHPHKEVISILKNNNVKIRRTDLEGTIRFASYIF